MDNVYGKDSFYPPISFFFFLSGICFSDVFLYFERIWPSFFLEMNNKRDAVF